MRVWIDIDNSPQARYLFPLVRRFEGAGHDVLLTARDHGDTFPILRSQGADFKPIGTSFGKGIPRKLYGLAKRRRQLTAFVEHEDTRPDLVVTGSRSATLAARKFGIPSFVIIDYEYVDLLIYRLAGAHIAHPNVIDARLLESRGIRPDRLMPFPGLKEDIAFADLDLFAVAAHDFGGVVQTAPRVLFRPPDEQSHYYRSASRDLAVELLRFLAAHGARIVFSPRQREQTEYLNQVQVWSEEPIVLHDPVPFVALLKGVDAVVSAGGTMLREAAYLGVPAYSIFRGKIGAVDRYLASIERMILVSSPADFSRITLARNGSISPLRKNQSRTAEELVSMIIVRAADASNNSQRRAVRRRTATGSRQTRVAARPSRPPR